MRFTDRSVIQDAVDSQQPAADAALDGMTVRVLFVEQRTARIRLIVGYSVSTVGTVPGVNSADNERGLLGITVDPGWPVKPYVYIHATDNRSGTHVVVSRFTLTGDLSGRVRP